MDLFTRINRLTDCVSASRIRSHRRPGRFHHHASVGPAEWSDVWRLAEPLEDRTVLASDFGDAPDTGVGTGTGNYETLLASGGPSHTIDSSQTTLFLGNSVDGDSGTLQNVRANADDVDSALPDDEDGVLSPATELIGTIGAAPTITLLVTNTSGREATLAGWIDYNNDGLFENATERATAIVKSNTSDSRITLTFPTIPGGFTGTTYARFRLSSDSGFVADASSFGALNDGEVEDYSFVITEPSGGTTGSLAAINSSYNPRTWLGKAIASLGDLDGDGVTDIVTGAGNEPGYVTVRFLQSDATAKSFKTIGNGFNGGPPLAADDEFGTSVANIGDVNGDGVTDIAVGAPGDRTAGYYHGAVYVIFLNNDGTAQGYTHITHEFNGGPSLEFANNFGQSVTGIGDLDGDGVPDLVVGEPDDWEIYVLLLNPDGTAKSTSRIRHQPNGEPDLNRSRFFGNSVASLGDIDNDGVIDLAVGAYGGYVPGGNYYQLRGAVHVLLMNRDGTVKASTKIADQTGGGPALANNDRFGSSVAGVGDLNGDGIPDLAVGARTTDFSKGIVYLMLLNASGLVTSYTVIGDQTGGGPELGTNEYFGSSIARVGDLNNDGVADLAVGATGTLTGSGSINFLFLGSPDVLLSKASAVVSEDDTTTTDSFTVVLGRQPISDVVFDLSLSPEPDAAIDLSSLTFTPANWDQPQVVRVTGLNDSLIDGDEQTAITIAINAAASDDSFESQFSHTVIVTTVDDDIAGFTLSRDEASVSEDGVTKADSFTVKLTAQPASDVLLDLSLSADPDAAIDRTSLTFTNTNWDKAQTINLTGLDDDVDDGSEITTVTISVNDTASDDVFDLVNDQTVFVSTTDDDTAGITVSSISSSTNEAGGTATFNLVLDSEPTADVMIELTSSDTTEGTVDLSVVTFTTDNWNSPQTVTVTGVDDDIDDGDVEFSIVTAPATGGDYSDFNPPDVIVTNNDDDTRGVTISAISGSTTEAGGTATFTVVLDTEPTADVMIGLTSSDTTEGTIDFSPLTFTPDNWNSPQTVTVTGVDDDIDDGDIEFSIVTAPATGGDYADLDSNDVDVTNIDNDTSALAVAISASSIGETDGARAATGTVSRNLNTTDALIVTLTSSDPSEAIVPTTVTIPAGQESTSFDIDAVNDFELDGLQTVTITASVDGFLNGEGSLNVTDDEAGQLDVDDDILANATTDGILVIRYLFGFTGTALVENAVGTNANLRTASEIAAKLADSEAILDADGDGTFNATTDGILVVRYLFGFTGDALVENATGTGAVRNTGVAVKEYLDLFLPASSGSGSGSAATGVTDAGGDLVIHSSGLATAEPLFTWDAVSQAGTYRIQIIDLQTNATIDSHVTTSPEFTATAFRKGQYRIWVQAISAESNNVVSSGWQEFTVAIAEESYSPFTIELTTGLMAMEGYRQTDNTLLLTEKDDRLPAKVESADEHIIDQIMANNLTNSWIDDVPSTPAADD